MNYITTQAQVPLTHKGDVRLIIGKSKGVHDKTKTVIVTFKPTRAANAKEYMYGFDLIEVKLTGAMFVYLEGNPEYYVHSHTLLCPVKI